MKAINLCSVVVSLFLLSGCATSASHNQSAPRSMAAAAIPNTTTLASNTTSNTTLKNVQITADASDKAKTGDTYYVQNRVLASGSSVSGALMGS